MPRDLVLHGGPILTFAPELRTVETLLVRDGRIAAVGTGLLSPQLLVRQGIASLLVGGRRESLIMRGWPTATESFLRKNL